MEKLVNESAYIGRRKKLLIWRWKIISNLGTHIYIYIYPMMTGKPIDKSRTRTINQADFNAPNRQTAALMYKKSSIDY
jgi:hypothetical protein